MLIEGLWTVYFDGVGARRGETSVRCERLLTDHPSLSILTTGTQKTVQRKRRKILSQQGESEKPTTTRSRYRNRPCLLDLDVHRRRGCHLLLATYDAVLQLSSDLGRNLVVRLEAKNLEEGVLLFGGEIGLVPGGAEIESVLLPSSPQRRLSPYRCAKTRKD